MAASTSTGFMWGDFLLALAVGSAGVIAGWLVWTNRRPYPRTPDDLEEFRARMAVAALPSGLVFLFFDIYIGLGTLGKISDGGFTRGLLRGLGGAFVVLAIVAAVWATSLLATGGPTPLLSRRLRAHR